MSVSASTSHALHQTLGDDAADEMVNWMNQMETGRAELRELNELTLARFDDRMAAQFSEFRRVLQLELSGFRNEMRQESSRFRDDVRSELSGFRHELAQLDVKIEQRHADLMKWSLVYWVGAVGSIAALARLLR